MRPRDRGVIVQVGSALSQRGIPLQATYCGAKHALKGFLDSLRVELLHDKSNVHVTIVQLPGLNTPQFGWVRTGLPAIRSPSADLPARGRRPRDRLGRRHPKRELWVGLPTVYTILGEKFATDLISPGRHQRRGPADRHPDRPLHRDDNLQSPPPGDPGAHGRFDDKAKAPARSCGWPRTSARWPGRPRSRGAGHHRAVGASAEDCDRHSPGPRATCGGRTPSSTASTSRPTTTPTATAAGAWPGSSSASTTPRAWAPPACG